MVKKADGGSIKNGRADAEVHGRFRAYLHARLVGASGGQVWSYNSEYSVSTGSNITLTKHGFCSGRQFADLRDFRWQGR